ncbi:hypothetical protein [Sciscionella marina]|uniref:hypothetical protein n=1 Tax=Sciscionella marina TaxID=508770 RepID=UPI0003A9BC77
MDGAGALLPRGERGEIVVRRPLVMGGYHDDPEATAESAHTTGTTPGTSATWTSGTTSTSWTAPRT